MRPRALLAVAAAVLLLALAGCAGLTPGDGETTTPSETTSTVSATEASTTRPTTEATTTATTASTTTTTSGERSLPVDEEAVFQRVEELLDVDATQPTVRVVQPGDGSTFEQPPTLYSWFGATNYSGDPRACMPNVAGSANATTVTVSTEGLDAEEVELLLVHEYVHAIQEQSGQIAVQAEMRDPLTKDIGGRTTSRAIVEGGAVYATDAYAEEYDLAWGDRRPMEMRQCLYENPEHGVREIYGMYYFGGHYFEQRLDSPADLPAVYQQPPRTAEQLVHGLERGSEPPAELDVTFDGGDEWSVLRRGPRGELFVRAMLTNELPDERAGTAAAGWGEDVAVMVAQGGTSPEAAAWALRFDTADDADEFAAAFEDLLATTETDQYPYVRTVRVDVETVVVLAGPETFVANATVSGSNANVTVAAPTGG